MINYANKGPKNKPRVESIRKYGSERARSLINFSENRNKGAKLAYKIAQKSKSPKVRPEKGSTPLDIDWMSPRLSMK